MNGNPAPSRSLQEARQTRRFSGALLYFLNDATFFLSHRLAIAYAAKSAGMEIHVATPAGPGVEKIREHGFCHHAVPIERWIVNPLREIQSILAIRRVVREVRPVLIHNVTVKPVLYGNLVTLRDEIAIVNAISGLGTVFIRHGMLAAVRRTMVKWLYRRLLRRPRARTILQNPDDLSSFLTEGIITEHHATLIRGSGVDLEHFAASPLPGGTPLVVLASRMLWDKGVEEFVRAAKKLRRMGIPGRFVLVGHSEPGNPASVSEAQLQDWHDKRIVEWWGRREDMAAVFARAYAVCLPSYREGLPKVLLEAAACGRPLIATDVPGCREVVRHGINGLLVPAFNAEALTNAIAELLKDRLRAEIMGKNSRELAEAEFGVEVVVDQTLKVYAELLHQ